MMTLKEIALHTSAHALVLNLARVKCDIVTDLPRRKRKCLVVLANQLSLSITLPVWAWAKKTKQGLEWVCRKTLIYRHNHKICIKSLTNHLYNSL